MLNDWMVQFLPWQAWKLVNIVASFVIAGGGLYMLFTFLDPDDRRMGGKGAVLGVRAMVALITLGCLANVIDSAIALWLGGYAGEVKARQIILNAGIAGLLAWVVWFHESVIKARR
jgi:hypothetical protein